MYWIALQPAPDAPSEALGEPDALVDAPTALAWWALQFTPLVARVDNALVLEISGSERLFGGRAALVDRIYKYNKPIRDWAEERSAQVKEEPAKRAGDTEQSALPPSLLGHVECAQGATSLIALGRLLSQSPEATVDALPLAALAAARPHLPTLQRLGCRHWGQLRALPRGGLVRRFGADLVDALDRAYGTAPEVYPWLTLPEVFDAPLELLASVESAPALLFGARRLLAQLRVWLQLRQRGVLALELLWELDARRSNALHVDAHHHGGPVGQLVLRTAEPTQDMQHLQRLLAERLERVTLPAPVLHLRLRTLQTQAMAGESLSLLPEDARKGDSLHQLLERLTARLGPQQVLQATLQADHRPERMQQWHPVAEGAAFGSERIPKNAIKSGAGRARSMRLGGPNDPQLLGGAALYPSWLLATPQRLAVHHDSPHYQGPLTLLAGPHRLEAGWLDGDGPCALRDYFVARSAVAGLVWVYRERLTGGAVPDPERAVCWYLHGLFA